MPSYKKQGPNYTLPAVGGRSATVEQLPDGTVQCTYKCTDTEGRLHEAEPFLVSEVQARIAAAKLDPGNDPPFDAIVALYPNIDNSWFTACQMANAALGNEKAGFNYVP